jgi:hypothetical protein
MRTLSSTLNSELGRSHAWLPITQTTDEWANRSMGVWLYYAQGCSDVLWNCGRTISGRHKLHVAAQLHAMLQWELNSCRTHECQVAFLVGLLHTSHITAYATPEDVRESLRWSGDTYPEARNWPQLVAQENALQDWIFPTARKLGFESVQFLMNPMPCQGDTRRCRRKWHTELWDIREDAITFDQLRWNSSFVRGLRCNHHACRLEGRAERSASCLSCEGCSTACHRGAVRRPR